MLTSKSFVVQTKNKFCNKMLGNRQTVSNDSLFKMKKETFMKTNSFIWPAIHNNLVFI